MDRALPDQLDELKHKKELNYLRRMHVHKVLTANKQIDNSLPNAILYPRNRAKKAQLLEGKSTLFFFFFFHRYFLPRF